MDIRNKSRICGVVVLYNPEKSVENNIKSYLHQIDYLLLVDNSETRSNYIFEVFNEYKNVKYIPNQINKGIAYALNQAGDYAVKQGYDFLFTVDQDSSAERGLIIKLIENFKPGIGIVSPHHLHPKFPKRSEYIKPTEVPMAMTSGNLLNIKAYLDVGGFDNKLFIDYVDYDICFRLAQKDWKVVVVPDAILHHNLGNIKRQKFLGKDFHPSNHSPHRLYYRTRNSAYVRKNYKNLYPDLIKYERKKMVKIILKVILFEKRKFKKLIYIVRGYIDYLKKKFGPYEKR